MKTHRTNASRITRRNLLLGFLAALLTTTTHAQGSLVNPGFEDGQAGWDAALFQQYEGLVSVDRQRGHTGNVSLRVSNPRGTESPEMAQTVEPVEPGAEYRAVVWVVSDGPSPPVLAALRLEFLDAEGKLLSRRQTRRVADPGNWQELDLSARAGRGARKARLRIQVFGKGAVWFDDAGLSVTEGSARLVVEPERQRIEAGRGAQVRLLAHLPEPWDGQGAPPVKITVNRLPEGASHSPETRLEQLAPDTCAVTFELPSVTSGGYRVNVALPEGRGVARALVYVPGANRKPGTLTDNGIFLANKSPFLPIGLCHVAPGDYPEVARQGFNCVQGPASLEPAALGASLKAALDEGLLVDVPLYAGGQVQANQAGSVDRIKRYARHPAVLSWKLLDQPEQRGAVADEVPDAAQKLKALDGQHPFALAVADADAFHLWAGFCDVLQVPVFLEPDRPLVSVGQRVAQAKSTLEPWQNLTVILPAGWRNTPPTQPTSAQARTMLYLAFINGARGVFWYAYKDPGWALAQTQLWERFKELNEETRQLAAPLLGGTPVEGLALEPSDAGVEMLALDHAGKRYVLLANPGDQTARVALDPGLTLDSAPCLRGRPAEIQEGRVVLELPGPGAETLVLPLPPSAGK